MAHTTDAISEVLEDFVRSHFRVPPADRSFHRDLHLYDSGVVDSAGLAELIAFLESRFDFALEDEDVFSDDFTTVNGISRVVHHRLSAMSSRAAASAV